MSVGHAYTDELTQHKHLKSALLLWVMLCILISLYIQLIELMTLSELGGLFAYSTKRLDGVINKLTNGALCDINTKYES